MLLLLAVLPALNMLRVVWTLDADGLIPTNGKLPTWDFTNTWAGGVLAGQGRFDVLFDQSAYLDWLRSQFGARLASHEWSYPPTLFLLAVPLAKLPLLPSYFVWTIGTCGLLLVVLRGARLPLRVIGLVALSPALWNNIVFGQNGALTASFLVGGLLLARSRPVVAGALFGMLTLKPHLGVLVPIFLVATGNRKCLVATMISSLAVVGGTLLAFGVRPFAEFATVTQPLMRSILEAPWPTAYQAHAVTVFLLTRALGGTVAIAYGVQAIAFCGAGALLWRAGRSGSARPEQLATLAMCLTFLATPYGYSYDMIPVAIAVAITLESRTDRSWRWLLYLVWVWPGVTNYATRLGMPITPILVAGLAAKIWIDIRQNCLAEEPASRALRHASPLDANRPAFAHGPAHPSTRSSNLPKERVSA